MLHRARSLFFPLSPPRGKLAFIVRVSMIFVYIRLPRGCYRACRRENFPSSSPGPRFSLRVSFLAVFFLIVGPHRDTSVHIALPCRGVSLELWSISVRFRLPIFPTFPYAILGAIIVIQNCRNLFSRLAQDLLAVYTERRTRGAKRHGLRGARMAERRWR